jgi:hypothetical protein
MHDVFVSHSSKDKQAALAMVHYLEDLGIRCWVAPRDIAPGKSFAEAILDGISGTNVMVLILSASANTSPHVQREVERALSSGKPVIPVRIEDVRPTGALDYFISSVHWIDAFEPPMERHFQMLADHIAAVATACQSPPAPFDNAGGVATAKLRSGNITAKQPEKKRGWGGAALIACLLLAVAGGGWWWGVELPRREAQAQAELSGQVADLLVRAAQQTADRQWSDARETCLEILQLDPKNADARKYMNQAEDMIKRPRGTVIVTASPEGATVRLGEGSPQPAPATFNDVPVGSHQVVVELPGYKAVTRTTSISRAGQELQLEPITLVPQAVNVKITTDPPGLAWTLNPADGGEPRAGTGADDVDLEPGRYEATWSQPQLGNQSTTVEVEAGAKDMPLNFELPYAMVAIDCATLGAAVYSADGTRLGATPFRFGPVKPGTYTYTLKAPGYVQETVNYQALEKSPLPRQVSLAAAPASTPRASTVQRSAPIPNQESAAALTYDPAFEAAKHSIPDTDYPAAQIVGEWMNVQADTARTWEVKTYIQLSRGGKGLSRMVAFEHAIKSAEKTQDLRWKYLGENRWSVTVLPGSVRHQYGAGWWDGHAADTRVFRFLPPRLYDFTFCVSFVPLNDEALVRAIHQEQR